MSAEQQRPNVVYAGSNDGMLHGFRTGAFDNTGNFSTSTTPNDGLEVLAYVPGSLLLSTGTGGACASFTSTGTIVQNLHGMSMPAGAVTPLPTQSTSCITPALDFSSPNYGHNFFVDATPGTGDLYYGNAWHTWLAGGLGAGGAAIFALDVTNPVSTNFTEANAANLVIGEWTAATISCVGDVSPATCGTNLGATYGTPIIRRLHDGNWAVIFGNGYGSASGDAGIYVMTVDSITGKTLFYYLSTGKTGANGIAYVTSADLDGDHITDYVYAGDLQGNIWRFDLTSSSEATWKSTAPAHVFRAPAGQSVTTSVTVSSGATPAGASTIMITFGTGKRTQFNNSTQVSFEGSGGLYGVWDWQMTAWNAKSSTPYAFLAPTATGLAPTGADANVVTVDGTTPFLLQRTFSLNSDGSTRDINGTTGICWRGSSCTTTAQFGWYLPLYGTQEQIIYNPQLLQGVFTVNSIVAGE